MLSTHTTTPNNTRFPVQTRNKSSIGSVARRMSRRTATTLVAHTTAAAAAIVGARRHSIVDAIEWRARFARVVVARLKTLLLLLRFNVVSIY
jgi:hypothetical protein